MTTKHVTSIDRTVFMQKTYHNKIKKGIRHLYEPTDKEDMSEKTEKRYSTFLLLVSAIFLAFPAVSESAVSDGGRAGIIDDGIYEDDGRFFVVKDSVVSSEVLKSFYGFWYDGIYEVEDGNQFFLAQIDDGLYIDWWSREEIGANAESGGVFWAPGSNVRDLALTPYPVKERLSGWFIVPGSESDSFLIYEIPYWKADVEYTEDLASFTMSDGKEAYVLKHIKIGDVVYTCAAGRRKVVRNPVLTEKLPGTARFSDGGIIMVLDEPCLVKADIADLQEEIDAHNAIRYPPRFSTADIREPSIYKQLEEMKIEW